MWQHVKLSEQIRPWDTLACCWDVKQPRNKLCLSFSLSLFLALSLSLLLCLCLSIPPPSFSLFLFLFLSFCLSFSVSLFLSICLFLYLSLSLYLSVLFTLCLSVFLSVCFFFCFFLSLSFCQTVEKCLKVDLTKLIVDWLFLVFVWLFFWVCTKIHMNSRVLKTGFLWTSHYSKDFCLIYKIIHSLHLLCS